MPRIDVPDGRDPLLHLWGGTGNELTGSAAAFSDAVYRKSTLPLREFEAARITIARVNDCSICLGLRPQADPGQAFYDSVLGDGAGLAEREALAAEFAQRFAVDHLGMDDALWERRRPPSATTSWFNWGCAWVRGWRSDGSTGSSASMGPAGSLWPRTGRIAFTRSRMCNQVE